jgi:hypothetical protein
MRGKFLTGNTSDDGGGGGSTDISHLFKAVALQGNVLTLTKDDGSTEEVTLNETLDINVESVTLTGQVLRFNHNTGGGFDLDLSNFVTTAELTSAINAYYTKTQTDAIVHDLKMLTAYAYPPAEEKMEYLILSKSITVETTFIEFRVKINRPCVLIVAAKILNSALSLPSYSLYVDGVRVKNTGQRSPYSNDATQMGYDALGNNTSVLSEDTFLQGQSHYLQKTNEYVTVRATIASHWNGTQPSTHVGDRIEGDMSGDVSLLVRPSNMHFSDAVNTMTLTEAEIKQNMGIDLSSSSEYSASYSIWNAFKGTGSAHATKGQKVYDAKWRFYEPNTNATTPRLARANRVSFIGRSATEYPKTIIVRTLDIDGNPYGDVIHTFTGLNGSTVYEVDFDVVECYGIGFYVTDSQGNNSGFKHLNVSTNAKILTELDYINNAIAYEQEHRA